MMSRTGYVSPFESKELYERNIRLREVFNELSPESQEFWAVFLEGLRKDTCIGETGSMELIVSLLLLLGKMGVQVECYRDLINLSQMQRE